MRKTVLFVPGFVVDVYSEIEASFVELCATPNASVDFLWLVPPIDAAGNRYARAESRMQLREPVWVEQLRRHRIPFVVGDIRRFDPWHNIRLFRRLFREHSIDAVYTHFGFERFWAAFCARCLGKTTIWNEHWHSLGTRHTRAKRLFYRLCVDAFISVSSFITRTLPPGIPAHTILNAINGEAEMPDEAARAGLRARLGIPPGGAVVMMVAEFRPDKRHFLALDVCREVARRHEDTVFVFLGDGATRREFLQRAAERGLDRVIAPGHVDNVNDYYAVADVCLLTSHNEPFGYCVLEAMKFGIPMVTFDAGGPAEILKHGETGILVKEGDIAGFAGHVVSLLGNLARRAALGRNARRAVQNEFSRDAWKRAVIRALAETVNGAPASVRELRNV